MSTEAYDPTAPEGDNRSHNDYISMKDAKVIGIVLIVLGAALYPLYRYQVRQSQKSICTGNMKAISEALNMYAEGKDDRFPPIYRTGKGDQPGLGDSGLPYTWCDDIAPLMSKRYSFVCPSASEDEYASSENPLSSKGSLKTTYGMYLPYSAFPKSLVANPDQTAIIGETSNLGSEGSYDPLIMKDDQGRTIPDGFVIGWDNSNTEPNSHTKSVTRLAFPGSDKGVFSPDGQSRHDSGIHFLTASGEVRTLKPPSGLFTERQGSLTGMWAPPLVRP